jgi:heptosyltransferase-2
MTLLTKSATGSAPHPRILVRATNWIGDVVMTMPAIQRLRELEPESHIVVLCPAKLHDLWRHNPHVSDVVTFDDRPSIPALRRMKFDVAILLPNSFRAAWEAWRAGIPCRIGFAGHHRRWLLTDVVQESRGEQPVYKQIEVAGKSFRIKSFPEMRHQTRRYLDLISYMGGNRDFVMPRIRFGVEDIPAVRRFMKDDGRPVFAINAGAEFGPAKRWMTERFATTALMISEKMDCRWLLLGGPGDAGIAGEIEATLRQTISDESAIINVAGRTTLVELFGLLKMTRVLLTNDTGPMHVAYALGTPLVAIFGSTSPELTGPLGDTSVVIRERVECSPCFLRECPVDFRCMDRVTPEQVATAVMELYERTKVRPHEKRF